MCLTPPRGNQTQSRWPLEPARRKRHERPQERVGGARRGAVCRVSVAWFFSGRRPALHFYSEQWRSPIQHPAVQWRARIRSRVRTAGRGSRQQGGSSRRNSACRRRHQSRRRRLAQAAARGQATINTPLTDTVYFSHAALSHLSRAPDMLPLSIPQPPPRHPSSIKRHTNALIHTLLSRSQSSLSFFFFALACGLSTPI